MDISATPVNNPMNKLRRIVQGKINNESYTWYRVAYENNIHAPSLYRFRNGGGLDGENTIKLMAYFKINLEDLK